VLNGGQFHELYSELNSIDIIIIIIIIIITVIIIITIIITSTDAKKA
jgi:hypothetical protein